MVGIYLSGTGNTKFCMEKLVKLLEQNARCIAMEREDAVDAIKESDFIVLGYPVQFSNAPIMVRDFIKNHSELWRDKKILCVATQAMFSGDGAGCAARILKKHGAIVVGGLHLKMPDSISDSKLLKNSDEKNREIISKTEKRIIEVAYKIKNGQYPKEGLNAFYHVVGLLGQRLWFYNKTIHYSNQLKISDECVGCGLCEKICSMNNMKLIDGKVVSENKCTMCYRCISQCPKQAITLLGKSVKQQYRFPLDQFTGK